MTSVTMPVLGLTMEEGTVAQWLKSEGEAVRKDEPLLLVEMDKGTVEVPSPAAGVLLRVLVPEGKTVPVRTPLAELGEPGEQPGVPGKTLPATSGPGDRPAAAREGAEAGRGSAPASPAEPMVGVVATPSSAPAIPGVSVPRPDATRQFASPRARMRARELGVDLAQLQGSGPHGRIIERDVLVRAAGPTLAPEPERLTITPLARRLALEHGVALAEVRGTGPGGRITQEDVLRAAEARAAEVQGPAMAPAIAAEGVQALSRTRRITAERMAASARSVARVTLFAEADFTELARFRQQLQPEFARLGVPKLPWDAILARAAGMALAEHPYVNASWMESQGIQRHAAVHVGVAAALEPEGLVVPVLRDADTRSLRALAGDLLALLERVRARRLAPAEMQGGTFSITNLGAYRVDAFTPIVNPPETAILGVGRIAEKPAVVEGRIEPRTLCTLSLSFDHRVVDGAPAAAFLARLLELLEHPYALLGM